LEHVAKYPPKNHTFLISPLSLYLRYSGAGEGIYEGVYAMLLCRVACGQMFRMLRPDHQLVDQVIGTTTSAVLGDREAMERWLLDGCGTPMFQNGVFQ